MERQSDLIGKTIPETLEFLEYGKEICWECGEAKLIYNCPFCGAPVCCHGCICPSLAECE